jgi:hypothetical protein
MQLETTKTKNNGIDCFMVEFPPVNGKRQRKFFSDEKEGDRAIDAYKKSVKLAGEWWVRQPEDKRLAIQITVNAIEDAGLTIQGVWEDHKRQKLTTLAVKNPKSYEDCVAEWKRRKLAVEADEVYVNQAGIDLMKFGEDRAKQPIHEIQGVELDAWISAQRIKKKGKDFGKPWGLSTKKTWISLFSGLWECAIAIDAATENITNKLMPIKKPSRIKRIYGIETEKQLLAAGLETASTRQHLITEVLGLFGCMRPDEISSAKPKRRKLPKEKWFGWKDIDLKNGLINVSTDVAKEDDERVITLQPVAVKWLKVCKDLECPLPPVGEFRLRGAICRMIGLKDGIRDGFRKTCATHLRGLFKNDHDTGREMGHSADELIRSYALLKTPEAQSLEHWMLSPDVIEKYRKSREWKKVLRDASEARQDPSANESATSED